MIRIGQLNRRLTLEEPAASSDGTGGRDVAWVSAGDVWANVHTFAGREHTIAEAVTSQLTHRITIRHRNGIGPHMRFSDGARIYDILTIGDVKGDQRWLVCHCRQRPAL